MGNIVACMAPHHFGVTCVWVVDMLIGVLPIGTGCLTLKYLNSVTTKTYEAGDSCEGLEGGAAGGLGTVKVGSCYGSDNFMWFLYTIICCGVCCGLPIYFIVKKMRKKKVGAQ